jgi:folate-dependent phosphoribosylglycinamide formyltransferase PurN
MSKLIRMGVLVSGSGTILQSFIDAAARNELGAEIAWSGITADLAANSSARLHCST